MIASVVLDAHFEDVSVDVLVKSADSKACTAFTHLLPCLYSIRLQSSSKQASSVVRLCEEDRCLRLYPAAAEPVLLACIALEDNTEPSQLWTPTLAIGEL